MTDRSKFEQMLEYLISEDQEKAKEIFHQLVVEKSREIYENILAEEFKEEDEESEYDTDSEELEGDEDTGEVGGDDTDDFLNDIEDDNDESEDDMGSDDGDIEDRVMDLEDALDELRAEFEQQLSGEDSGEMDLDSEDSGIDEFDSGDEDEELKDGFDMSDNFMREYIEKVTSGHGAEKKAKGDNGDNTKSVIDNMKNDMGGTAANIAAGGEMGGKSVQSGLLKPNVKEIASGNINVPGAKAGKTAFKKREPGHGAERKGSGDMGDKAAKSPLNGLSRRAK